MLRMTFPGFVFRALCKEGHDPSLLLANTGLNPEAFSDPRFLTELPPLRKFFLNALEVTDEPHLGVRLGRKFEAGFIGLPAYAAMNASTFDDALSVLARFFFLAFPAIRFSYREENDQLPPGEFSIRLRPELPLGDLAPFATVSALMGCEGLCKAILRTPNAVLRAELPIPKPDWWSAVEDQIDFPILFEAPDIRLYLPDQLLTTELPGADPLNHPRLVALCEKQAERARSDSAPLLKITRFLNEDDNLALPVSQIAAALGYSERSFRRHLERSGTSFRELANEIREQKARNLIANTSLPIQTIATRLGFDTPSNFSRSFKRWTGKSPTEFRLGRNRDDEPGQI